MKKIAFIFPGQGSQYVGMGKDFFDSFKSSKDIFTKADEILGYSLSDIIFNGPDETLKLTKYCQLAVFVNSCAILAALKQTYPDMIPTSCAGLSLGEYSALYASGKICFEDALKIIKKRAELMSKSTALKKGTMLAVLGVEIDRLKNLIDGIKDLWVANLNTPQQIVLSGSFEAIEQAKTKLTENGIKKLIQLNVEGAFHTPFMDYAKENLKGDILKLNLKNSSIGICMNANADILFDLENIKRFLIQQITSSVMWYDSIMKMDKDVDLFIEIGCSKTLTNMNKKININAKTISVEKVQDINLAVEAINA